MAFDKSTISRTQVQLWYNLFKEGREDINGDGRSGRPSTSTTHEAVKKMILRKRGIVIREISDDVGISFGSCQAIFTGVLGMKRAAPKIVSKLLHFEQKQHLMDIA